MLFRADHARAEAFVNTLQKPPYACLRFGRGFDAVRVFRPVHAGRDLADRISIIRANLKVANVRPPAGDGGIALHQLGKDACALLLLECRQIATHDRRRNTARPRYPIGGSGFIRLGETGAIGCLTRNPCLQFLLIGCRLVRRSLAVTQQIIGRGKPIHQ